MLEKLKQLKQRYIELTALVSSAEIIADQKQNFHCGKIISFNFLIIFSGNITTPTICIFAKIFCKFYHTS